MEQLIAAMIAALTAADLSAGPAMEHRRYPRLSAPAVAVGLKEAAAGSPGLFEYLGELDGRELYGKRLQAQLGLEVCTPASGGGSANLTAVNRVLERLSAGVAGLTVAEVAVGPAAYDSGRDCFACTVTVTVLAYLYATAAEDGAVLTDFRLKGEIQ